MSWQLVLGKGVVLAAGAVDVVLAMRATAGIDALVSTVAWLGAGMFVVGLALAGWALLLRSRDRCEPTD